jgi:hypothetical protein
MDSDYDQATPRSDDATALAGAPPKSLLSRGFVAWTKWCLQVPAVITLVEIGRAHV